VHQVQEYKRNTPRARPIAHVVGFTNVEDHGQEGVELAFQRDLAGRDGQRRVIKDRLGRVVEDIGESVNPVDGRDIELSIDSKVQFFAYQRIRDAVTSTRPRPAAWWCSTCRAARCWRWPTTRATPRATAATSTGAQLRNRALTDTFEPGSTMKPFDRRWRSRPAASRPDTHDPDRPGRLT
jgi:cell division protein FtsI (penicillin-binding protein 3)